VKLKKPLITVLDIQWQQGKCSVVLVNVKMIRRYHNVAESTQRCGEEGARRMRITAAAAAGGETTSTKRIFRAAPAVV